MKECAGKMLCEDAYNPDNSDEEESESSITLAEFVKIINDYGRKINNKIGVNFWQDCCGASG